MGNLGSFTLGPCFGQDKHLPLTAWYLEISLLLKALMLVFIDMLYVYDIFYLPHTRYLVVPISNRKRAHGDLIGESPQLTCSLCPKRFWIPSELRYHTQRVHEGRKDFACGQCSKRFADRKNLRKHMVTVHKTEEMSGLGGGFEARPMVGYKQM